MKAKYNVYRETGFDPETRTYVKKLFKTFKNERDALSYYNDPKNTRAYGTLYLEMVNNAGRFDWNDFTHTWHKRSEFAAESL